MDRLISADELKKKAHWMEMLDNNGIPFDVQAVSVSSIDLAPTIDAVKVVRCINCDNYAPTKSGKLGYCCVNDGIWFANDFCIHGRPKEGE